MKKVVVSIVMLVLIAVAAFGVTMISRSDVSASDEAAIEYVSVEVESGDSLWSIAKENYSEACGDFNDYVDLIRDTNSMKDDNLIAGNYICVPIYNTEYK